MTDNKNGNGNNDKHRTNDNKQKVTKSMTTQKWKMTNHDWK